MKDLAGRTAVITGAGSGLGLEMARRAHALGMRLVLADVEPATLGRIVDEIRASGGTALG
jgi:NAD(P)-dependent dehydrogenase (short-subunit alcohol dehydrogenase family)